MLLPVQSLLSQKLQFKSLVYFFPSCTLIHHCVHLDIQSHSHEFSSNRFIFGTLNFDMPPRASWILFSLCAWDPIIKVVCTDTFLFNTLNSDTSPSTSCCPIVSCSWHHQDVQPNSFVFGTINFETSSASCCSISRFCFSTLPFDVTSCATFCPSSSCSSNFFTFFDPMVYIS